MRHISWFGSHQRATAGPLHKGQGDGRNRLRILPPGFARAMSGAAFIKRAAEFDGVCRGRAAARAELACRTSQMASRSLALRGPTTRGRARLIAALSAPFHRLKCRITYARAASAREAQLRSTQLIIVHSRSALLFVEIEGTIPRRIPPFPNGVPSDAVAIALWRSIRFGRSARGACHIGLAVVI